jgi:hypothetical protein
MNSLIIVWSVSSDFDSDDLESVLTKRGLKPKKLSDYMLGSWFFDGLTVNLYEKKLVVQGKNPSQWVDLLRDVKSLKGLSLDEKNEKIFSKLQPVPNAVICDECGCPTYTIEARKKDLDLEFINECGHTNSMEPPFKVLNTRILPDLNVVIANSLSRAVLLGFFNGFEIVIPDFMLYAIDNFLGKGKQSGALNELEKLKKLARDGKISLYYSASGQGLFKLNAEDFNSKEDDVFFDLANLTNSILLTTDKTLKVKASIKGRPIIFLPDSVDSHLKFIEKARLGE